MLTIQALLILVCVAGATAAVAVGEGGGNDRCSSGRTSPDACWGTPDCCWVTMPKSGQRLCEGRGEALSRAAGGDARVVCDPHQFALTVVSAVVSAVGVLALIATTFTLLQTKRAADVTRSDTPPFSSQ